MEKQCADAVQVSSADDLAAYCESVLRRYSVMHRENRWAVVEGARYLLDRQYPDGWQLEPDVHAGMHSEHYGSGVCGSINGQRLLRSASQGVSSRQTCCLWGGECAEGFRYASPVYGRASTDHKRTDCAPCALLMRVWHLMQGHASMRYNGFWGCDADSAETADI